MESKEKRAAVADFKGIPDSMAYYLKARGFSHELCAAAIKCWKEHGCWKSPAGHCWGEPKVTMDKQKAVTL